MTDQFGGEATPQAKLKVFISYSRRDLEFADRLVEALKSRGIDAIIDKNDLPLLEDWERELLGFIRQADTVVFIVSPASLASPACQWEVDQVRALSKRLAPISLIPEGQLSDFTIPSDIKRLNYVFFSAPAKFEPQADALAKALNTDSGWWKEHARLVGLALRWNEGERPADELLRGTAISAAETWAARRPVNALPPPEVFFQYVAESRAKFDDDDRKRRRLIGRAFVKPAEEANKRGEHEHALRLAATGAVLANDISMNLVPELWPPLSKAIASSRTINVLKGHKGAVIVCAFSPDGKRVITGSSDKTVRLWNAETGAEINVLTAHSDIVVAASFSPDGKHLVTGSHDTTARLWNSENGNEIAILKGHYGLITAASFSPDGRRVVTGSVDYTARLWDAETGREVIVLKAFSSVNTVSFSPDGQRVVTGSGSLIDYPGEANVAQIWDAESGVRIAIFNAHTRAITAASFSPDGKCVVTGGSKDMTARLWDAATGREIVVLKAHTRAITAASFSPDGKSVVTASSDNTARLWHAESGREIAAFRNHTSGVHAASFSPDGTRILTGSSDNTARLWDAQTGRELAVLRAHTGSVLATSFSPDGKRVLTASGDKTARLWDAATGREIAVFKANLGTGKSLGASFSPDGECLITGIQNNRISLWNAETKREVGFSKDGIAAAVLSFSSSGQRVVTGSGSGDNTARVFDAVSGGEIAILRAHKDTVQAAMFSADATRLVTGSDDNTARVWDTETGREVAVLKGHTKGIQAASFSPDGKRIVTGSADYTARLWDAECGAEIARLKAHRGTVCVASFSPDGARVITGSDDNTARVWDADLGREIVVLKSHTKGINAASFSPNGKLIVTGSEDFTARLWCANNGNEIAVFDAHSAPVHSASISLDGKRLVTSSTDNTARIFDISCVEPVTGDRAILLTAALARGMGLLTTSEREDILMQGLPDDDMFGIALSQLGRPIDDPELQDVIAALHAPLHPNCYLSPTQFAEKFRLNKPPPVPAAAADADTAEPSDIVSDAEEASAIERMPITTEDLVDQQFIETHAGVAIFRLAGGRYHVVSHFAVKSLEDARAAAEALAGSA